MEFCIAIFRIIQMKNIISKSMFLFYVSGQKCVEHISCFRRLRDLNIFQNFSTSSRKSGLTTAEQCQILVRLKELVHLRRGDFLCDVLEYIDSKPNLCNVRLKIEEFWPSEDYHFHNPDQMTLVKTYCPSIKDVNFMFRRDISEHLSILENFSCLTGNFNFTIYLYIYIRYLKCYRLFIVIADAH